MRPFVAILTVCALTAASLAFAATPATRTALPMRVVFIGDSSCDACVVARRLIDRLEAAGDLRGFSLIRLDAVDQRAEVERLEVTTTPALRVIDADGQVLAGSAGPMDEQGVRALLATAEARTLVAPPSTIVSPDALFDALDGNDPTARRQAVAAIERDASLARVVVDRFARGTLRSRLPLLDVLNAWSAPVANLDPWRPETIDDSSLAALREWATRRAATQPTTRVSGAPTP